MELVAENLENIVVLNAQNVCSGVGVGECRECVDVGGLIHNWIVTTEQRYLIIDLQDEKDVCRMFLTELMQLRKRLRMPFLFAGVMERPRRILEEYDFAGAGSPLFVKPEDAVVYLKRYHNLLIDSLDLSHVKFGEPIVSLKALQLQRAESGDDLSDEDGAEADL